MLRAVPVGSEAAAIDTIVLAFAADPIARWVFPDEHDYLTSFPKFTRAFGGRPLSHNSAQCTEDFGGVALWLPPNVPFDEKVREYVNSHSAELPALDYLLAEIKRSQKETS